MRHMGEADVLHIGGTARHLDRDVAPRHRAADDAVLCRRLWRRRCGGFAVEIELGCELAVAELAAIGSGDDAVANFQSIAGHAEAFGRLADQQRAHLRAGQPERGAALLDRLAAGGIAFVRGLRRVAGNHLHTGERQIELFGGDLCQRRRDTLTQLDLAGEDDRRSVGVDAQPGIEHALVVQATRQFRRLRAGRARRQGEGEDQRPRGLAELSPGEVHRGLAHVFRVFCAARNTARMMRPWVPHRHRFCANASRTSTVVGCGWRSSSSFAVMIMPLMQ